MNDDLEFIQDGSTDESPAEDQLDPSAASDLENLDVGSPGQHDAEQPTRAALSTDEFDSDSDSDAREPAATPANVAEASLDLGQASSVDGLANGGPDVPQQDMHENGAAVEPGDELGGTADVLAETTDESAMAESAAADDDEPTDDVEVEVEFSDTLAFRGGDLDDSPLASHSPPQGPEAFVERPPRFPAAMPPSLQFEPIVFRVMSPEGTYTPRAAPENEADAENSVSQEPDATAESEVDAGTDELNELPDGPLAEASPSADADEFDDPLPSDAPPGEDDTDAYLPSLHEADSRSPRFEPRTVELAVSVGISVNKVEQIAQIATKEAGILAERVVDDRFEVIREEQFRRDAHWRALFR